MYNQVTAPASEALKKSNGGASDLAQVLKVVNPKHPALSRLHTELKAVSGTSVITSYDRMHHRHNRS